MHTGVHPFASEYRGLNTAIPLTTGNCKLVVPLGRNCCHKIIYLQVIGVGTSTALTAPLPIPLTYMYFV